jgi:deoxycytidylate deaminase
MSWSQREKALMRYTVAVASNSVEPNRHGAVIVRKSVPISTGWNKNKTHPAAVNYYSRCIHAELAAIIALNRVDLTGTHIYVARIMRSKGEPLGLSRPCKQCMTMIHDAGIKRLYYTDRQGGWEVEKI